MFKVSAVFFKIYFWLLEVDYICIAINQYKITLHLKFPLIISLFLGFAVLYFSCAEGNKNSDSRARNPVDLWKQNCTICHGKDGSLAINGAKDLKLSDLSMESRELVIKKGKGLMIGFEDRLSDKEIKALAQYTLTFKE